MLYSCTYMATVGVKGLNNNNSYKQSADNLIRHTLLLNLRREIVVNSVCDHNDVITVVTKVPVIRDIRAAVVVCMQRVDRVNHRPLTA